MTNRILTFIATAITLLAAGALTFGGCQTGSVSVRDIALDVIRGIEVQNTIWITADSICSGVTLRHPVMADSIVVFYRCWPTQSTDTTTGSSTSSSSSGSMGMIPTTDSAFAEMIGASR